MIYRRPAYRAFILTILLLFCVSSLADIVDQDNLFPAASAQWSSSPGDDNFSLDKKKKALSTEQNLLPFELHRGREPVGMLFESIPSATFTFSPFLRAPPLA
jgi:hypothetical protein